MGGYSLEADQDITMRQLERMRGMQYAYLAWYFLSARDLKKVRAELESSLLGDA